MADEYQLKNFLLVDEYQLKSLYGSINLKSAEIMVLHLFENGKQLRMRCGTGYGCTELSDSILNLKREIDKCQTRIIAEEIEPCLLRTSARDEKCGFIAEVKSRVKVLVRA